MISCKSVIRLHTISKFASQFVKSKPLHYFKLCSSYHNFSSSWKIDGARNMKNVMDRKKQKTVTPVWRPVSTHSTNDASAVMQVKAVSQITCNSDDGRNSRTGIQVEEEVKLKVSNDQIACDKIEASNEPVDLHISSTTSMDVGEGRGPGEEYVPSTKKHLISLQAGASLIRFIKGKGGSTQKEIEEEFAVKIIFPSSKEDDYITLEGNSADNVAKASERIKHIIDEAVNGRTVDYSHFISLPLAIHPELVDKLVNFQRAILGINNSSQVDLDSGGSNEDTSDEEDGNPQLNEAPHVAVELKTEEDNERVKLSITNIPPIITYQPKISSKSSTLDELGIDKSIFIKPHTFHLTVLMLKLWNKDRVNTAAEVLQSVSSKVMDALDNRPVSIRLNGLTTMRGSLAKARVLYIPVEDVSGGDRLMNACQVIIDEFVKAGLVLEKDAQQKLKLHATVMNARHRKRNKRMRRKGDYFDARDIVKQYGSEKWGEYLIREAHLSQRFAFDKDGYYHCRASIPFPANMQLD